MATKPTNTGGGRRPGPASRAAANVPPPVAGDAPASVDEYLAAQPADVRAALERLRDVIRSAAPQATEVISYRVPTYRHYGSLVGFGATKRHCTFYVMSVDVMRQHAAELSSLAVGKGSIRFTPDRPLPAALVRRLVQARIAENERLRKQ